MERLARRGGLWANPDFLRLWGGQAISDFGSMVSRTAIPFLAVLTLEATPGQVAGLRLAGEIPAFLVVLVAGVWVDRLRRRPLMIGADLARALLLGAIPLFWWLGWLSIWSLCAIVAVVAVLTVLFDVAWSSYLPGVVEENQVVDANGKLTTTALVAEASAFSLSGWLVQWLTAPLAILVDAASFLGSAVMLARIEVEEPTPPPAEERIGIMAEAAEGFRTIRADARLRAVVISETALNLSGALFGTVYLIYMVRELGFRPGVLGMIFAVGGITSLGGVWLSRRLSGRVGVGLLLAGAVGVVALGQALPALARDATVVGAGFLILQQCIVDPAWTLAELTGRSLRQVVVDERTLGRVNASVRLFEFGMQIVGVVLAGWLSGVIGVRGVIWLAAGVAAVGALLILRSPARTAPPLGGVVVETG